MQAVSFPEIFQRWLAVANNVSYLIGSENAQNSRSGGERIAIQSFA